MQYLIDKVMSNPVYLTIGVILIVVLFYAIFKRIMKLLIFLFRSEEHTSELQSPC